MYRSVRQSGIPEGRIPHPLSFNPPCNGDTQGQTSTLKPPQPWQQTGREQSGALSVYGGSVLLQKAPFLQLQNVWRESSPHLLWLFETVFPAVKGNFCSFLPPLCLTAMSSWEGWSKMCQWKMRSKAVVRIVQLFRILGI